MQIFVQAKNEAVVINGEIIVTIVDILEDEVVLAIDGPEWIEVCKTEALETLPVRPRYSPLCDGIPSSVCSCQTKPDRYK